MSNNLQRYGFRWQGSLQGVQMPVPVRKRIANTYQAAPGATNVDLWAGDPVKLVNDGTIALCAAGDATYGIIAGFGIQNFSGNALAYWPYLDHLPGGTASATSGDAQVFVFVIPVAGQVFEVCCDDATTATTEAAYNAFIEENCDITINADATAKKAFPLLDISGHGTATATWRIIDTAKRVDTDYSGTYVPLLVTCNEVQQSPYIVTGV